MPCGAVEGAGEAGSDQRGCGVPPLANVRVSVSTAHALDPDVLIAEQIVRDEMRFHVSLLLR